MQNMSNLSAFCLNWLDLYFSFIDFNIVIFIVIVATIAIVIVVVIIAVIVVVWMTYPRR